MPTIQQIRNWVILHLEGQLGEEERKELQDWMNASPANEQAIAEFMEEARLKEGLRTLYHSRDTIWERLHAAIPDKETAPVNRVIPLFRRWWAAAAILLLLGGGGYLFLHKSKDGVPATVPPLANQVQPGSNKAILTLADGSTMTLDSAGSQVIQQGQTAIRQHNGQLQYTASGTAGTVSYNKLTIPRGSQYQVILPDGSKVWLNAASSLKYPTIFNGQERHVELTGEAYFDITANAAQPFMVSVNQTEIQVLGTVFNINAYPEEARLQATLISGAISVKTSKEINTLKPGKMATVSTEGDCSISTADIEAVTAWKAGYFRFDQADIPTVMRQLERWYDITVKYEGKVPERRFSGEIGRNMSLADVLEFLKKARIRLKREGNIITVLN